MYESSGRLDFALINTGSKNVHHDVGLFDDCLEIHANDIYGQYCSVFFKLELIAEEELDESAKLQEPKTASPTKLYSNFLHPGSSFCLPSSCNAADLRQAVAQQIGYEILSGNYSVVTIADDNYCYSKAKKEELDTASIVVM